MNKLIIFLIISALFFFSCTNDVEYKLKEDIKFERKINEYRISKIEGNTEFLGEVKYIISYNDENKVSAPALNLAGDTIGNMSFHEVPDELYCACGAYRISVPEEKYGEYEDGKIPVGYANIYKFKAAFENNLIKSESFTYYKDPTEQDKIDLEYENDLFVWWTIKKREESYKYYYEDNTSKIGKIRYVLNIENEDQVITEIVSYNGDKIKNIVVKYYSIDNWVIYDTLEFEYSGNTIKSIKGKYYDRKIEYTGNIITVTTITQNKTEILKFTKDDLGRIVKIDYGNGYFLSFTYEKGNGGFKSFTPYRERLLGMPFPI